uniref:Exodeoxyribonuclease V subunit alpha n=1 Tax=Desulfatirhabdium butyrativorans TaxID=340467 RepID=A0A7C4RUD5_9BACT
MPHPAEAPASIERLFGAGYLTPYDYHLASTLGKIAGEGNPLGLLAVAAASHFTLQGHSCVDLYALSLRSIETAEGLCLPAAWPKAEFWIDHLNRSPLVWKPETDGDSKPFSEAPLVLDAAGRLYLARMWCCEQRLAAHLNARLSAVDEAIDLDLLQEGLTRYFGDGGDPVRTAAETGVRRRFAVISGGPGTGKTTTVLTILALLVEQALYRNHPIPNILVLAPTGKAAARLREVLRRQDRLPCAPEVRQALPTDAATIHRGLGARSDGGSVFRYHARNPLPADIVVVDEASMIDLALMDRLFEATALRTKLLLLGDRNQLASVESGSVMSDLCRIGEMDAAWSQAVVHLTKNYRFSEGSGIGRLARAITAGQAEEAIACLKDPSEPDIRRIEPEALLEALEAARTWLKSWLTEAEPETVAERFNRFRILCAHRQGPFGVERINGVLDRMARNMLEVSDHRQWYPGRPVMVLQNDYRLHLSNGDIGWMRPEGVDSRYRNGGTVRFVQPDGRWIAVSPHRLPAHETAYAMTIHKSQGSEFDDVLVVLPERRSPILTRELLYTAVTRARRTVVIVGSEEIIRQAVATPIERYSGLMAALCGRLAA